MTTESRRFTVAGIAVEVVRKDIKNLHLGVYPPHGRVRVAVPRTVSDEAVRLAVIDKLGWIRKQRAGFAAQPRQSSREMVNGESHYFLGRRYRLRVHEQCGALGVHVRGVATIDLFVRPGTTAEKRDEILQRWYRERLRALVPPLLDRWEQRLKVRAAYWGIKKMKTKWGSCNARARRIWLNLELAKKPSDCIEYILVHELVHLLEHTHGDRFTALMDKYLPDWRRRKRVLNSSPLAHELWHY